MSMAMIIVNRQISRRVSASFRHLRARYCYYGGSVTVPTQSATASATRWLFSGDDPSPPITGVPRIFSTTHRQIVAQKSASRPAAEHCATQPRLKSPSEGESPAT